MKEIGNVVHVAIFSCSLLTEGLYSYCSLRSRRHILFVPIKLSTFQSAFVSYFSTHKHSSVQPTLRRQWNKGFSFQLSMFGIHVRRHQLWKRTFALRSDDA